MVFYDQGQPSILSLSLQNIPLVSNSHVNFMTRRQYLAQVTSTTGRTVSNVGNNIALGKPIVSGHSITRNVVIPSLVIGQPSWLKAMINQPK